jgi:hypothetical protein
VRCDHGSHLNDHHHSLTKMLCYSVCDMQPLVLITGWLPVEHRFLGTPVQANRSDEAETLNAGMKAIAEEPSDSPSHPDGAQAPAQASSSDVSTHLQRHQHLSLHSAHVACCSRCPSPCVSAGRFLEQRSPPVTYCCQCCEPTHIAALAER